MGHINSHLYVNRSSLASLNESVMELARVVKLYKHNNVVACYRAEVYRFRVCQFSDNGVK